MRSEREGLTGLVVGSIDKLPTEGLLYGRPFFDDALPLSRRAQEVQARSGRPLQRWQIDPASLQAARASVESWTVAQLEAGLQRLLPNLVRVPIADGAATVLIHVPRSASARSYQSD